MNRTNSQSKEVRLDTEHPLFQDTINCKKTTL